jgi:hypothetical protein
MFGEKSVSEDECEIASRCVGVWAGSDFASAVRVYVELHAGLRRTAPCSTLTVRAHDGRPDRLADGEERNVQLKAAQLFGRISDESASRSGPEGTRLCERDSRRDRTLAAARETEDSELAIPSVSEDECPPEHAARIVLGRFSLRLRLRLPPGGRRRWRQRLRKRNAAPVSVTDRIDDGDGCYEEQDSHEDDVSAAHP